MGYDEALFLPCKQQADATCQLEKLSTSSLFLPCKQQADATVKKYDLTQKELFLPCKQQADATVLDIVVMLISCFYLANSRQMQRT